MKIKKAANTMKVLLKDSKPIPNTPINSIQYNILLNSNFFRPTRRVAKEYNE